MNQLQAGFLSGLADIIWDGIVSAAMWLVGKIVVVYLAVYQAFLRVLSAAAQSFFALVDTPNTSMENQFYDYLFF